MKKNFLSCFIIIISLIVQAKTIEETQCPAKVPLTNIVYPWPHKIWPEVHVFYQYEINNLEILELVDG